ncbi:protein of unknown function [Nitrospina watsonii]|uniref:Secreted protein n=1 Tax=Nitrospina watsonii TaxID=1323948 RepID=A0ABN8W0V0_9BACT|nr:protein of unknown function [Nitrospina watsonii]
MRQLHLVGLQFRMLLRSAYFQYDIALVPDRLGPVQHSHPRLFIGGIGKLCLGAGTGLNRDFKPELDQLDRDLRGRGHALLSGMNFFRNANFHRKLFLLFIIGSQKCPRMITKTGFLSKTFLISEHRTQNSNITKFNFTLFLAPFSGFSHTWTCLNPAPCLDSTRPQALQIFVH